ncbi:MAG: oligosaccharide flippase family protein [Clostridioides sp.]|jgi:O-antigen/teichoic acid export membrane protein|uniref:Membrane protein involved in the export of O-antigen and teichoic acid n=1 Tax=Lacrimispora sphenoides JCM 1415 TaxID=1297793 RepID=A0ABY1CI62_9FIRM|nr:oligosaccharide flippase family protein [Lacrimispora sphenoides]MDR1774327.1 oligosaccharide flippase family protein [Clostridioides sp.]SEU05596.1 Membrane protein involved in the export of O-antigen and teichoic acid [[Clostridium] sphenoides JCM 1415]SUY49025.1 putative polysaccharide transporter [Lacrimispora sphenoides]
MKESRSKYLLKNTAIFTIGNFATKIISFFLIPLYTSSLCTAEYGIVDLVATIPTVTIPIITLNIIESVMRFNMDKDADKDKITKIGMVILLVSMVVGLILIPICRLWDKVDGLETIIYLYVISLAASQLFLCDLRGKEELVKYCIGNIANTALIALFNICFLVIFKLGITGYLLAYTLANTLIAVYAFIIGKGYKAIFAKIDKVKMIEMIKYSVVLIPNSFMWWIINSSDHIMVTSMIGVAANGVYAISYKVPTLINTFTGIFNQAWGYSAIKEEGSKDETEYSNKVFANLISAIMIIGICMMSIIKPFLNVYVADEYFEAWKYTPFLIVGIVYITLGTFLSTSYMIHKDSMGFLLSGSFGAMLNIILNFLLIPLIGVYGAAIATCVSYIGIFSFRVFHTRKYLKYKVLTRDFCIGTVALWLSGALMFVDNLVGQICQILIAFVIIVLFQKTWKPLLFRIIDKVKKVKK